MYRQLQACHPADDGTGSGNSLNDCSTTNSTTISMHTHNPPLVYVNTLGLGKLV
jgi:hypothetical protein